MCIFLGSLRETRAFISRYWHYALNGDGHLCMYVYICTCKSIYRLSQDWISAFNLIEILIITSFPLLFTSFQASAYNRLHNIRYLGIPLCAFKSAEVTEDKMTNLVQFFSSILFNRYWKHGTWV